MLLSVSAWTGGVIHRRSDTPDIAAQCPSGQWMNCMKLLGQKLAARDFSRQTAEHQARVAILNRFTAVGIPVTQHVI